MSCLHGPFKRGVTVVARPSFELNLKAIFRTGNKRNKAFHDSSTYIKFFSWTTLPMERVIKLVFGLQVEISVPMGHIELF